MLQNWGIKGSRGAMRSRVWIAGLPIGPTQDPHLYARLGLLMVNNQNKTATSEQLRLTLKKCIQETIKTLQEHPKTWRVA